MTNKEMGDIAAKVIQDAVKAGLPIHPEKISGFIGWNNRKKALGLCSKKNGRFYITISKYMENVPVEDVRNTIAHEVVHYCDGCFDHGSTFQRMADKLSKYGYSIGTHATREESVRFAKNIIYKYSLICDGCGHVYNYSRMNQYIKHKELCTCNLCHTYGKFTLKQNY